MNRLWACSMVLSLALAAPAWAAGNSADLLRQGAQAPGPGVMRDANGNRTGTIEQKGGSRVIYDNNGKRVGTMERSGSGWVVRDPNGNRVGAVDSR